MIEKLKELFARGAPLEVVFEEALSLLEGLKAKLEGKEREATLAEMQEMQGFFAQESARLLEAAQFTEGEILTYAAEAEHFTPEQFQLVSEARERLNTAAQNILNLFSLSQIGSTPSKSAPQKVKKSGWMKS